MNVALVVFFMKSMKDSLSNRQTRGDVETNVRQLIIKTQEDNMDLISKSVGSLKNLSQPIGSELDEQNVNMNSIVKSGYLKRYSKSFLSGGWNNVWVVLYQDSSLCVYKRQGDYEIKAKAFMKEVSKHFAYGEFTEGLLDRPDIPAGYSIKQMLAIPVKPSHKSKLLWFLCRDETELHEWMSAICSTLPKPSSSQQAPPQQQYQPIQPQTSVPVNSAPPPYSAYPGPQQSAPYPMMAPGPAPGGPGPIGFAGLGGAPPQGYPQQPQAYPQQPYQAAPQAAYPQQAYAPPPQAFYPQQAYGAPPQGYSQPPPPQGYSQPPPGAYGYQQQPAYYQQQQPVVVQKHKKKGGMLGSNTGKIAAGALGGAALGYGASRMMGGGMGMMGMPFGGFGLGHHGSWSSLSSFGSCGSFGSFGSFD